MNPSTIDGNGRYQRQYAPGVSCLKCGAALTPGKVVTTHSTGAEKGRICVLWADGRTGCNWPENSESQDKARAAMGLIPAASRPATSQTLAGPASADPLTMAIVHAVEPILSERLKATVDEDRVLELVEQALNQSGAISRIEVRTPSGEVKRIDGAHPEVAVSAQLMLAGYRTQRPINIYWFSAPGSGKSYSARALAEVVGSALGTPEGWTYDEFQWSKVSAESSLKGFIDAHGNGAEMEFAESLQRPGVTFIDEIDRAGLHIHVLLNPILANRRFRSRAIGEVTVHPQRFFLAAGNSTMQSPDALFPEAIVAESSTIDRWTYREFTYDDAYELRVAESINPNIGPWVKWVQSLRPIALATKATDAKGRIMATPRASYDGAVMLGYTDVPLEDAARATVFKGIPADTVTRLLAQRPLPSASQRRAMKVEN